MKKWIECAKEVQDNVIRWRRDLHQIPEIGLELPQTVNYVMQVLSELEVDYDAHYIDGNAIVAKIRGSKPIEQTHKVLALRADMDGLPILEETGLPFASQNGCMHACGHDAHTAILLGVAQVLQASRHLFGGEVRLIFQPGEEYPGGAKPLLDEGAFDNPTVTRVIGLHVGSLAPTTPNGTIVYRRGPMMAAMDRIFINIEGKGCHGAYPEGACDPIVAAAQLIQSIQTIKSRNIRATTPAVVSVTRVTSGFNQNIIPNTAELEGTVRTLDIKTQNLIEKRLQEMVEGNDLTMNVRSKLQYERKYPAVINDIDVTDDVVQCLSTVFGEEQVVELQEPLMGGEDFAFYLQKAPGTFLYLTNPRAIDGVVYGHHHPKFDIDESLLYKGVAMFLAITMDYLS